jgi:hypothetical protein
MKARVKATGEIIEVKSKVITFLFTGKSLLNYVDQKTGISYFEEELFFPKDLADDPDYWTHLEHQYAGMAMQGMLSNPESELDFIGDDTLPQALAGCAARLAHALVEKIKEERK